MSLVVRYTLMRLLVFLGVLCALWLLGLRGEGQRLLLLALSVLVSMAVSYVVLRPMREDINRQIAAKVEARVERQRTSETVDEQDEDR